MIRFKLSTYIFISRTLSKSINYVKILKQKQIVLDFFHSSTDQRQCEAGQNPEKMGASDGPSPHLSPVLMVFGTRDTRQRGGWWVGRWARWAGGQGGGKTELSRACF